MSNVVKCINIVSTKMVKESSFFYQIRQILSSNHAYEMIREQLEGLDREQFIITCLNTKNEPTNITVVSVGSLNKAIVHPREVFKTVSHKEIIMFECVKAEYDYFIDQLVQLNQDLVFSADM